MKTEKMLCLDFNKTRQVKQTIEGNSETLRLYANGVEFSYNRRTGGYVGCGIDAAHSFMGWYVDAITRTAIKRKIEVTEWPSHVKNAAKTVANGFMEVVSLTFWDSWDKKDEFFTTPAQMAVGLQKLVRNTLPERKAIENETIRYTYGSEVEVIERIRYHLRRAMPVVALIRDGVHYVTIVGMVCKYKLDGSIDVANTTFTYINLTAGGTYSKRSLKSLEILGWGNDLDQKIGHSYSSSWVKGSLISLKSDAVLFNDTWTKGWNGKIFEANNKQYLFLLKERTGDVHIHNINNDGSVGTRIIKYNWTKGWSNCHFYTIKNNTYLLLMKAGSGSGFTNGLVRVHKINNDGTVGELIQEKDWTKGWFNIDLFKFNNKHFLVINKNNGLIHFHEMKDNGTIGNQVLESHAFLKQEDPAFFNTTKLKTLALNNRLFLYCLANDNRNSILAKYEFCFKNGIYFLNVLEEKNIGVNYSILEVVKDSVDKATLLVYKGGDTLKRDGLMHIYDIKSDGKLDKLKDENHFKNEKTLPDSSFGSHIPISKLLPIQPSLGWSSIQLFKTKKGKSKMFLLDAYSGKVRILNMNDDNTCVNHLLPSKPLKYYKLEIKTGAIKNAGTDAHVYVQLKGSLGISPKYKIDTIYNDYEKSSITEFNVVVDKYFGEISEIIVEHDNRGHKPGWYLEEVKVSEEENKTWTFSCNKWLTSSAGDGLIKRSFKLKYYDIEIKTGNIENAGTNAKVYVQLKGKKGTSNNFYFNTVKDDFEKNSITKDRFFVDEHLGEIEEVIIRHDNTGNKPGWFVEYVKITESQTNNRKKFICNNWLAVNVGDYKIKRTLTTEFNYYDVKIKTGNVKNAGTDAKVFVRLKGTKGSSDLFYINSDKDDFEKNSITSQRLIVEKSLGDLLEVSVFQNNIGKNPGWYLEYVSVKDNHGKSWKFNCNNWLAKTASDGKTSRVLSLEPKYYEIKVKTGNVSKAGTDAKVFVDLRDNSGHHLKYRIDTPKDDFEKNSVTVQKFLVDSYFDDLKEIVVEHDNSGKGAGWFLDYVTIKETATKREWNFPCNKWLATSVGDKKIKRVLKAH
jgi:hypothetical protein